MLGTTLLLNVFGNEPRARKPLEMIQRSAQRMEAVLEMLTDIASLQSGRFELEYEDVDAHELIEQALEGKQLEYSITRVPVHCDRKRLCRVLSLALANAAEPIRIYVERRAGQVLFVITDTTPLRPVEQFVAHGIVTAHGGELWTEGGSIFISLPEA